MNETTHISPLLPRSEPSLPSRDYFDGEWHERELDAIWGRSWIHVGRIGDFAPGTMRRIDLAGINVVLIRDGDGRFSAFHNTCRHRGAELCSVSEKPFNARLIACPYHQWAYDLSGRLVGTPFVSVPADFRKEDHGLFRVHLHEWNGFLFACAGGDPPPFSSVPDIGPQALDNWPMAGLIIGHRAVMDIDCNWKIFWENYNECLHCPGIHKSLSEAVPIYGKGYMAPNEAPDWRPGLATNGTTLAPGRASWTVDGQACGPEFPGLSAAEREAGQIFVTLLPSLFVVAHRDYVRTVSVRPLGPQGTQLAAEWLFEPATLSSPGFDLANVVDFAARVMAEDAAACEMNQRGLRSKRFDHGTLMPQEFEVFRFHNWVRAMLGAQSASATSASGS